MWLVAYLLLVISSDFWQTEQPAETADHQTSKAEGVEKTPGKGSDRCEEVHFEHNHGEQHYSCHQDDEK